MTLIAEVFPKLGSPKNKVGSISIEYHLNLVEILNILKKKMTLIAEVFRKLLTPKNMVTSMSKKSRFKISFGKQHGKRAKTLLKFACSTSTIFIVLCEGNCLTKSLC